MVSSIYLKLFIFSIIFVPKVSFVNQILLLCQKSRIKTNKNSLFIRMIHKIKWSINFGSFWKPTLKYMYHYLWLSKMNNWKTFLSNFLILINYWKFIQFVAYKKHILTGKCVWLFILSQYLTCISCATTRKRDIHEK